MYVSHIGWRNVRASGSIAYLLAYSILNIQRERQMACAVIRHLALPLVRPVLYSS